MLFEILLNILLILLTAIFFYANLITSSLPP